MTEQNGATIFPCLTCLFLFTDARLASLGSLTLKVACRMALDIVIWGAQTQPRTRRARMILCYDLRKSGYELVLIPGMKAG